MRLRIQVAVIILLGLGLILVLLVCVSGIFDSPESLPEIPASSGADGSAAPSPEQARSPRMPPAPNQKPSPKARPVTGPTRQDSGIVKSRPLSIAGTVRGEARGAIANAEIRVWPRPRWDGPEPPAYERSTRTAADGGFVLPEIPIGLEEVIVEAWAPGRFRDRRYAKPGDHLEIVLGPQAVLVGRVTWMDGSKPCADATVSAFGEGPNSGRAVTTADGRYRIESLKPESYEVQAWASDGGGNASIAVALETGRETTANLVIEGGVVLRGRVLDAATDAPIVGARLQKDSPFPEDAKNAATAGADGVFALSGLDGHDRVRVQADGYAQETWLVRRAIGDGPEIVRDFRLNRAATLRGRVVDAAGRVVIAAEVEVMGGRSRAANARTDDNGDFEIAQIAVKEERWLAARKAGFARGYTEPFTLAAGENRSGMTIRLGKGAAVSGRVTNSHDKPVAGARVSICARHRRAGRNRYWRATTTESGTYRVEHLPAGRYQLLARAEGLADLDPTEIEVVEDGDIGGIDFVLESGLEIRGMTRDQRGEPIAGVFIRAESDAHRPFLAERETRTGKDGRFTLAALRSGNYRVQVSASGFVFAKNPMLVQAGTHDATIVMHKAAASIHGRVHRGDTGSPVPSFLVRVSTENREYTDEFADSGGRFRLEDLAPDSYRIEAITRGGLVTREPIRITLTTGEESRRVDLTLFAGGSVSGTVLGPNGESVAGAQVRLRRSGSEAEYGTGSAIITGPTGHFRLAGLAAGEYSIRASHPKWIDAERLFRLTSACDAEIELKLFAHDACIRVHVSDTSGKPVPDARVLLLRPDGTKAPFDMNKYQNLFRSRQRTDPELDYTMFRRTMLGTDDQGIHARRFLPPGRYLVEVAKPAHAPARAHVTAGTGQPTRVMVTLRPIR